MDITLYLVAFLLFCFAIFFLRKNSNKEKEIEREVGTVLKLFVYPIKACGSIDLTQGTINQYGFEYDRQWVLTKKRTDEMRFITQRQYPNLTLVKPSFHNNYLHLDAPGMKTFRLPLSDPKNGNRTKEVVGVWKDKVEGVDEGDDVAEWFTLYLNAKEPIRLMRYAGIRKTKTEYQKEDSNNVVSFVDRFSFLLINKKSVEALNEMIGVKNKYTEERYRPNIFVEANQAWEEDTWEKLKIGNSVLYVELGCDRCKVTTVEPHTGLFDENNQPLKTIKSKQNNPTVMGQLLTHTKNSIGTKIQVGMKIYSLKKIKKD